MHAAFVVRFYIHSTCGFVDGSRLRGSDKYFKGKTMIEVLCTDFIIPFILVCI